MASHLLANELSKACLSALTKNDLLQQYLSKRRKIPLCDGSGLYILEVT